MSDSWKIRLSRALVPTAVTCAMLVAGVPSATADEQPLPPAPAVEDGHDDEDEPHDAGAGDMSGEIVPGPVAPPTAAPGTVPEGLAFAVTPTIPAPPVTPPALLGTPLDAVPGYYMYSDSCDPVSRTGVTDFAALLTTHYNKSRHSLSRPCKAGDRSNHYEGRALDWSMNAFDPRDKLIGDSVAAWLSADNGAVARRFGVMTIIWNRAIWYSHRPSTWQSYSGPSPHTDHLHFSFTWDGAFGRTSWWTGVPVTVADHGTCRVYAGQYAPLYTKARPTACPSTLPVAPLSPKPVYLPGAVNPDVAQAQSHLGVIPDGSFGPQTRTALLSYQTKTSIPITGVLDNATWARMLELRPSAPYQQVLASRDFSGDGFADVVVVDSSGRLWFYPGVGSGRLGTPVPSGLGWGAMKVYAPGDWDGDGHSDIMAVDPLGRLWLYGGTGRSELAPRVLIGRGWGGFRIAPVGDANEDGVPDLLAVDREGNLRLYAGAGAGALRTPVVVGQGWRTFALHAAGDKNGDGDPDILGVDPLGKLYFYPGLPGTAFGGRTKIGHGWAPYILAAGGDFDHDGRNDLLGRGPDGSLRFYPGGESGSFGAPVTVATGW